MGVGALALAAMILNFVAPKAAHAIVATAVQVINTSATPVMTRDVDAAGPNAYILNCGSDGSTCATATVPVGHTFVLDSISIYGQVGGSYAPPVYAVISLTGPSGYGIPFDIPLTSLGGGLSAAAENLTAYATSGTTIQLHEYGEAAMGESFSIGGYFSGHLVSAPAGAEGSGGCPQP